MVKAGNNMDKMAVYNSLPVSAQNFACYIQGVNIKKNRYGMFFEKKLREYEEHLNWSYDHLCEYRDAQLREMIKYCYDTVPYYHKQWGKLGINYEDIKRAEDLIRLPILDKQIVKEHSMEFLSSSKNNKKIKIHYTSGTTGAALPFHTTWEEEQEQWAVWWRYRRGLGIKLDTKCALFGGKVVVPSNQSEPPFWRYNKPCNQIYFSAFHINSDTWRYYYDCIKNHNIKWIHGYPSIIASLAQYMLENNALLDVDIVTIGAETLYQKQREVMEKAFLGGRKRVYQHYGLTEGVANISETDNHKFFVDEDFAISEFLNNDEGFCNIIGTSLKYRMMPLLRYNTGDLIKVSKEEHNLINCVFEGRASEIIILDNNRVLSSAAFSILFANMTFVKEAQILYKNEKIYVKVVPTLSYKEGDENIIVKEMKRRCGSDIDICIQLVDEVIREKSGKLKLVIRD